MFNCISRDFYGKLSNRSCNSSPPFVHFLTLAAKMNVQNIPPKFVGGSLEVKQTSDNIQYGWIKMQRWEESEKRSERVRKNNAGARKSRNVAKHCVCPMLCGSGGSKNRLAKVAGAEPSCGLRDEKLHALVAPSRF